MNTQEFITYWSQKKDHDNTPAVGIGVYWERIPLDSEVKQFKGNDAWQRIGNFYAPLWGNFARTRLSDWLNTERPDYQTFIDEEKVAGKIKLYEECGLIYPEFCAIADTTGSNGVLGDGSHRYIDCNYLIIGGKDMRGDIDHCSLDVLCVSNLESVLYPVDFQKLRS